MTIRDALDLVTEDHDSNGHRDAKGTRRRAERMARMFDLTAPEVTLLDLMHYAKARGEAGAAAATINRELSVLRRGCHLAEVPWPTRWTKRREAAPRSGFTDRAEVERVCAHLKPAYADAARFCFLTGWRRGEATALRWSEVDLLMGEVRLLAGTTKNREPRVFPLYPQLRALLEARAGEPGATDLVFHHGRGKALSSFSHAWRKACVKAGSPVLLLHDFRRTAARNLLEAGVDRQVAMKLLGHKTESIFNRYRITTTKELTVASEKLSKLLA